MAVPKISFDYQLAENFSMHIDNAEARLISIATANTYLWGDDPRHLSFKFNQYRTHLDFILKYRADIFEKSEAERIVNVIEQIISSNLRGK